MLKKTETVEKFLKIKTHTDLAELYDHNMECQINVAQDGGEIITGEYRGKPWRGFTDGLTTWKHIRIPWNAKTDNPHYEDTEMRFDLAEHVEGIGMTGWDWYNQQSLWVGFDFDSIVGHSVAHQNKLKPEEIEEVKNNLSGIDWVTIRKSTGGFGLHIYVFLDLDIEVKNHTEHAAIARCILGMLSGLAAYDFSSKVDICGGNMWVWHRKMLSNPDGLKLIKQGTTLKKIPDNWKDHLKVIRNPSKRKLPQDIEDSKERDPFEKLTSQRQIVDLDTIHKKLIDWLKEKDKMWWWDSDMHMLVGHTSDLQEAHEDLGLRGFFKTESSGSSSHNCFCFPLRNGAWVVRRYSLGVSEHTSWSQDSAGWTRTFLNKEADLGTAARAFGGLEDPSGGFIFRDAQSASQAAGLLGVHLKIHTPQLGRQTLLKQHKDGRLVISMAHDPHDRGDEMEGWLLKKKDWVKISNKRIENHEDSDNHYDLDELVRHLVTESGEDSGWVIRSDGIWRTEPLTHVKAALSSMGYTAKESGEAVGNSIFKPWKLVNAPFKPEYPGNRQWNRHGAQFRFKPNDLEELKFDLWESILHHCGSSLDDYIINNSWCKLNGISTGKDYLMLWIASLFQRPETPLPYLFLWGPSDTGKSSFHEALELLMTKGCSRADLALTNKSGFNGELEGSVLCVVEEVDLQSDKTASNRMKDWVTALRLPIRHLNKGLYHITNTTHWVQCANDVKYCPIFPGDTRITVCHVPPLNKTQMIPKLKFIPMLQKQAPDFLSYIMNLGIPETDSRLGVPVITTSDKIHVENMNLDPLQEFIKDKCKLENGQLIKYGDFYDRFCEWLDPAEITQWSKRRVSKELPSDMLKGNSRKDNHIYLLNITFRDSDSKALPGKYFLDKDNKIDFRAL